MSHDASRDACGCGNLIVVRIQSDGVDGLPITNGTTPAFGRAAACAQIYGATGDEQRRVAPRVPVLGRDKANGTVQVWVLYQRTEASSYACAAARSSNVFVG